MGICYFGPAKQRFGSKATNTRLTFASDCNGFQKWDWIETDWPKRIFSVQRYLANSKKTAYLLTGMLALET